MSGVRESVEIEGSKGRRPTWPSRPSRLVLLKLYPLPRRKAARILCRFGKTRGPSVLRSQEGSWVPGRENQRGKGIRKDEKGGVAVGVASHRDPALFPPRRGSSWGRL